MVSKGLLEPVAPGLWSAEHDLFVPPLRLHFPCRMCVVRLEDSSLLLHSPIPVNDALAERIAALGDVQHLLAPSCFHHLHIADCAHRYPEARVHAAPGLQKKRPDLAIDAVLGDEAAPSWAGLLEQVLIAGMPAVNEVVFYHRPTRSLLVTDLLFNIRRAKNLQTPIVLRLAGAWGDVAQSRLYRSLVRDRSAAAASARRVLAWEIERIVPAHGDIVAENAGAALNRALRRMAAV